MNRVEVRVCLLVCCADNKRTAVSRASSCCNRVLHWLTVRSQFGCTIRKSEYLTSWLMVLFFWKGIWWTGKVFWIVSNLINIPNRKFVAVKWFALLKLKTPWSESASELYRPSDRRLSAKRLPTCADRGCHMVSVTDPSGRILSVF
jgi:hypothetical protein